MFVSQSVKNIWRPRLKKENCGINTSVDFTLQLGKNNHNIILYVIFHNSMPIKSNLIRPKIIK